MISFQVISIIGLTTKTPNILLYTLGPRGARVQGARITLYAEESKIHFFPYVSETLKIFLARGLGADFFLEKAQIFPWRGMGVSCERIFSSEKATYFSNTVWIPWQRIFSVVIYVTLYGFLGSAFFPVASTQYTCSFWLVFISFEEKGLILDNLNRGVGVIASIMIKTIRMK